MTCHIKGCWKCVNLSETRDQYFHDYGTYWDILHVWGDKKVEIETGKTY